MLKKFLLFIFTFSQLIAFTHEGFILDEKGDPISNVMISNSNHLWTSDEEGFFELDDLSAADTLHFHKLGFFDRFFPAKAIPTKIILRKKNIVLENYTIRAERPLLASVSKEQKVVISQNELQQANDLAQLISTKSDLLLKGNNLLGSEKKLAVPGFKTKHTLVLLDGIPLNQRGEAFDLASVPLEIIESIEISENGSSEKGNSNQMGAVINIKTKRAGQKNKAELNYSFGSFGLQRTSLSFANRIKNFDFFVFGDHSFARNDFFYEPCSFHENPDSLRKRINNEKEINDLHLNSNLAFKRWNFRYQFLFQDFFKKLPGPTNNLELYENSRLTGYSQNHFLTINRFQKKYQLNLNLDFKQDHTKFDNTFIDSSFSNYFALTKAKNTDLGSNLEFEFAERDFHFLWGLDARYSEYFHQDILEKEDIKADFSTIGIFASSAFSKEYYLSKLELLLSAKRENTFKFGNFTSWKISPNYQYNHLITIELGGNINNGYTLPSFYDLYWQGDNLALGNPELEPETAFRWQIYSKVSANDNFLKFAYSHAELDNMITWIKNYDNYWKPINLEAAEIKKYKFSVGWNFWNFLKFKGNLNLIDARDRSKTPEGEPTSYFGKKLIYTPAYNLNLQATLKLNNLNFVSIFQEIGEKWTTRDQLTPDKKIAPYHLVDLSLNYELSLGNFSIKPTIFANNIFNKRYEIYEYNPRPGFNWEARVNLKYHLK